jgi:RNA exonuclease 4
MAPEILSNNWKKLQATLKKESQAVTGRKRKAIPSERQQNTIAKRRRLDGKSLKDSLPAKRAIAKGGRLDGKLFEDSLEAKRAFAKPKRMGNLTSSDVPEPSDSALSASLALWAEDNDISANDLAEAYGGNVKETVVQGAEEDKINRGLSKDVDIGKYVGLDAEFVGVGGDENRSVLARASIVNFHGIQVYDSFVRPKEFVTDWRTHVSGVSPEDMAIARSFEEVQQDVAVILMDRVLVGHAVKNDLEALILTHPKRDIRDTSKFSGFRKYSAGKTPSLKKLAKEVLGVEIQEGEHSSIEDARATMLLFRRHKSAFEVEHAKRFPTHMPGLSGNAKPKTKKKKANR